MLCDVTNMTSRPICVLLLVIVLVSQQLSSALLGRLAATSFTRNDSTKRTQLRIGLLLPADNRRLFSLQKCLPAMMYAISSARVKRVLPGANITIFIANSQCSSIAAPVETFNMLVIDEVHVLFGPVCDYSLGPVARYASHWDTPVISPGGMAIDFEKAEFSLLTRIGITFNGLSDLMYNIVVRYNWKNVKILYAPNGHKELTNRFCFLAMSAVSQTLNRQGIECPMFQFEHVEEEEDIKDMLLNQVGVEHAIIVLCNSPDAVRNVMLKAAELNFDNGDYVFFNIDLISREYMTPWFREWDTAENNERARRAYKVVKTITLREPETTEYETFSYAVMHNAKEMFSEPVFTENQQFRVNSFVVAFHDAVVLYALALNETIQAGLSADNGSYVTSKMWNRTFQGIRGPVTIDHNGDRATDYSLLEMNLKTGEFESVANYYGSRRMYEPIAGKVVRWEQDRVLPPPDVPYCGFDNSSCPIAPSEAFPKYAIVIMVLGTMIIVVAIVACSLYRHYTWEMGLAEVHWRIRWEDIMFGCLEKRRLSKRPSGGSYVSMEGLNVLSARQQVFTKAGYFKGSLVAVKKISQSVNATRPMLVELKMMRDLQHDHIVRFIGVCIDQPNQCIVTEYGQKGSLQDVLENDQLHLDNMFKFSLIQDIVRGMSYLHNSYIRSHGNLKSSNCIVDGRFVLKITDFGLHSLREKRDKLTNPRGHQYYREKLWTAPELLREKTMPPGGTQKGDVYSFAIICQEIIHNSGPFWLEHINYSPQVIVEKVRAGETPPTRPTLVGDECYRKDGCSEELAALIRRSWTEDPADRPDFTELMMTIVKRNSFTFRDHEENLVDNLLSRMEQYANNLEAVVEERTVDYLEQKKRAEELLHLMLPRSVAEQLMHGEMVKAEKFECVTIYFSDICGFTALSAESSPMQVIDMLNELYTSFDSIIDMYDVYKVETIGDAYMVASGLAAQNNTQHACEIARMALGLKSFVTSFKIRHRPDEQIKLRMGIHSGPVCGGIVGLKMPRYCLLGDTVNTASAMEATGEPLRIHVSSQTKAILDKFKIFCLDPRGTVYIEGKGEIMTWWLLDESSPDCKIRPAPCGETGVHWDRPAPSGDTEVHWDRPAPCGETGVHWDRPAPCGETGVHWDSSVQSFY